MRLQYNLQERSDGSLMALAMDGDIDALGIVFFRHTDEIHSAIHKIVGNSFLEQDVFHDVFLKIHNGLNKFRYSGESSVVAWMVGIAKNTAISYVTRSKRRKYPHTDDVDTIEGYLTAEHALMWEDGSQWVDRVINRLSKKAQIFLRMRVMDGLSLKEIGEKMNCNDRAAGSRVHKALNILRKIFGIKQKIKKVKKNFRMKVEFRRA